MEASPPNHEKSYRNSKADFTHFDDMILIFRSVISKGLKKDFKKSYFNAVS